MAVDDQGRPLPFQHLMRRFLLKHDVTASVEEIPVRLYLFDALYLDGKSLVDMPYHQRWSVLEEAVG